MTGYSKYTNPHQPTRSHTKGDVARCMKYYNSDRLHSANDSMSSTDYENSLKEVSGFSWPEQPMTCIHNFITILKNILFPQI